MTSQAVLSPEIVSTTVVTTHGVGGSRDEVERAHACFAARKVSSARTKEIGTLSTRTQTFPSSMVTGQPRSSKAVTKASKIRSQAAHQQRPTNALMKALPPVVGHEFLDDVPKVSFAEEDQAIQALVLDGAPDLDAEPRFARRSESSCSPSEGLRWRA
jgi:hypothetical protein